jgi:cytochrome P450
VSKDEIWRALRKSLTPTFTTGRLKSMIKPMESVADKMVKVLEKELENSQVNAANKLFSLI